MAGRERAETHRAVAGSEKMASDRHPLTKSSDRAIESAALCWRAVILQASFIGTILCASDEIDDAAFPNRLGEGGWQSEKKTTS
jgi:hypothetical protein